MGTLETPAFKNKNDGINTPNELNALQKSVKDSFSPQEITNDKHTQQLILTLKDSIGNFLFKTPGEFVSLKLENQEKEGINYGFTFYLMELLHSYKDSINISQILSAFQNHLPEIMAGDMSSLGLNPLIISMLKEQIVSIKNSFPSLATSISSIDTPELKSKLGDLLKSPFETKKLFSELINSSGFDLKTYLENKENSQNGLEELTKISENFKSVLPAGGLDLRNFGEEIKSNFEEVKNQMKASSISSGFLGFLAMIKTIPLIGDFFSGFIDKLETWLGIDVDIYNQQSDLHGALKSLTEKNGSMLSRGNIGSDFLRKDGQDDLETTKILFTLKGENDTKIATFTETFFNTQSEFYTFYNRGKFGTFLDNSGTINYTSLRTALHTYFEFSEKKKTDSTLTLETFFGKNSQISDTNNALPVPGKDEGGLTGGNEDIPPKKPTMSEVQETGNWKDIGASIKMLTINDNYIKLKKEGSEDIFEIQINSTSKEINSIRFGNTEFEIDYSNYYPDLLLSEYPKSEIKDKKLSIGKFSITLTQLMTDISKDDDTGIEVGSGSGIYIEKK